MGGVLALSVTTSRPDVCMSFASCNIVSLALYPNGIKCRDYNTMGYYVVFCGFSLQEGLGCWVRGD